MARIPGFHPGGPGSIPGVGERFLQSFFTEINFSAILAHYALGQKTCAKTKLVLISKH